MCNYFQCVGSRDTSKYSTTHVYFLLKLRNNILYSIKVWHHRAVRYPFVGEKQRKRLTRVILIFMTCFHIKIFHHYGILTILVEFLHSWNLTNLWDPMIKFITRSSLVPSLGECLQLVLVLNGKRVTLNVSSPT